MIADRLLTNEWLLDRNRAVVCLFFPLAGVVGAGLAIRSGIPEVIGPAAALVMAGLIGAAKFASP